MFDIYEGCIYSVKVSDGSGAFNRGREECGVYVRIFGLLVGSAALGTVY